MERGIFQGAKEIIEEEGSEGSQMRFCSDYKWMARETSCDRDGKGWAIGMFPRTFFGPVRLKGKKGRLKATLGLARSLRGRGLPRPRKRALLSSDRRPELERFDFGGESERV